MGANSLLKGNAFFEKYIRKNYFKYILVLFIYAIGFFIGIQIFNTNIYTEENSIDISNYIIEKIEMIGTNTSNAISSYIKQDVIEIMIIGILSFSIIGVPIIIVILFIKSLSLGVTISALIHACGTSGGLSFSILVFLLPSITKMFIFLLLICSSLKFIENILKYKKEIKYELVRHALANIIALVGMSLIFVYRSFSLNIISQILF